jgi:hypothetical protein
VRAILPSYFFDKLTGGYKPSSNRKLEKYFKVLLNPAPIPNPEKLPTIDRSRLTHP